MKLKIVVAIAALASALPAASALPPPSGTAMATIDWTSFKYTLVNTTGSTPNYGDDGDIQFLDKKSKVDVSPFSPSDAGEDVYEAPNWTSSLNIHNGFAAAMANASILSAQFTSLPTSLSSRAEARREGSFTLQANTLVTFYVDVSTFIDMDKPLNGDAYAWAYLSVDGPGVRGGEQGQHADLQSASYAGGLARPPVSTTLEATFLNLTSSEMTGFLTAFAVVSKNGFIPAIPEPRTYGMMLAGLGLLGFVAWRRKLVAVRP